MFQRHRPGRPVRSRRREARRNLHGRRPDESGRPGGSAFEDGRRRQHRHFRNELGGYDFEKSRGRQRLDSRFGLGQSRPMWDSSFRMWEPKPPTWPFTAIIKRIGNLRYRRGGRQSDRCGRLQPATRFQSAFAGTGALSAFDVNVENVNDENVYTFTGTVTIKSVMARIQVKKGILRRERKRNGDQHFQRKIGSRRVGRSDRRSAGSLLQQLLQAIQRSSRGCVADDQYDRFRKSDRG